MQNQSVSRNNQPCGGITTEKDLRRTDWEIKLMGRPSVRLLIAEVMVRNRFLRLDRSGLKKRNNANG